MKIKGVKEAVADYKRANTEGPYSQWYGHMMLDRKTGEVWTNTFFNLGHNDQRVYHDPAVCNLVRWTRERGAGRQRVTMRNARKWAEDACGEYKNQARETRTKG